MKKYFVILFVFTGLLKGLVGLEPILSKDLKYNNQVPSETNRRQALFSNKYWKQVKNNWKSLSNSLNMDIKKANKTITTAENNFQKNMQALRESALIDTEEFQYLNKVFSNRIQHIKGTLGLSTCYMTDGIPEMQKSYDTLEKSYKNLQQLHSSRKISDQAYQKAKETLTNELIEHYKLQSKYNKESNPTSDKRFIDLLTELNK